LVAGVTFAGVVGVDVGVGVAEAETVGVGLAEAAEEASSSLPHAARSSSDTLSPEQIRARAVVKCTGELYPPKLGPAGALF
jgi:hypothetical protein